jgi:hypothetical protein
MNLSASRARADAREEVGDQPVVSGRVEVVLVELPEIRVDGGRIRRSTYCARVLEAPKIEPVEALSVRAYPRR